MITSGIALVIVFASVFVPLMRKPRPDRLDELIAPYRVAYDDLTAGLAGSLNFPGPGTSRLSERGATAAGEGYLSAPVAPPCEQGDRSAEPASTDIPGPQRDLANERVTPAASHPRSSRDCGAGEPTNRSMGNWPMGREDFSVHGWARIARRQKAGWRVQAAISAARVVREGARQAALIAGIRERCAEPIPHLERNWLQDSGSFAAFVDKGMA